MRKKLLIMTACMLCASTVGAGEAAPASKVGGTPFSPSEVLVVVTKGEISKVQLWQRGQNLSARSACQTNGMRWVENSPLLSAETTYDKIKAQPGAEIKAPKPLGIGTFSLTDAKGGRVDLKQAGVKLLSFEGDKAKVSVQIDGTKPDTKIVGTFDAVACVDP